MSTFAFDDVLAVTNQNKSHCIFHRLAHPIVLSGLILTFIGLLIGSLIILIKKLHSTSIINICFMAITLIIMIIGVGLLNSPTKCDFIGCKATRSRKKIEDSLVLDMVCVWGHWNHFIDYRGGTLQLYCTRCSLDLLVLCNVDCDCRHSILFG
ncbi:unnamed protein product [Schistosoma haematobium]|nr:unnamed protein product [Schistosoma haematobium]